MKTIQVSKASGTVLDWLVSKCEALDCFFTAPGNHLCVWKVCSLTGEREASVSYRPSTDWSQGGPIIEREGICADRLLNGSWLASNRKKQDAPWISGTTPLIAAMRCYVASKLGDIVKIPDELIT